MSHGLEMAPLLARPMTQARFLLGLWALYPILLPFYFMGRTLNPGTQKFLSGVPQVADYYVATLMIAVFMTLPLRLPRPVIRVVGALIAFVCYTALVNGVWALHLENLSVLKSSLFYVYDGLLFLTCLVLHQRFQDSFLKVTVYAVAASVMLQAVLSPLAIQQGVDRQALFFNDENQLGYFCVLSATIVVLGVRRFTIPLAYQVTFCAALAYLVLLSQCRAALIGLSVLAVVTMLERPIPLILVLGASAAVYLATILEPSIFGRSAERLVMSGEYDTLATRGYDRILNYPEHIVFGAGEGAYERFRSALYASEIHSSYGTMLFCYGIIGSGLLGVALFWIAQANLRIALFLLPAIAYGSAHHGLRAGFFWAMLALLCCMALYPRTNGSAEGPAPHLP